MSWMILTLRSNPLEQTSEQGAKKTQPQATAGMDFLPRLRMAPLQDPGSAEDSRALPGAALNAWLREQTPRGSRGA